MKRKLITLALVPVVVALAACNKKSPEDPPALFVNGDPIPERLIDHLLQAAAPPERFRDAATADIMETLVTEQAILQKVRAAGLDKRPDVQSEVDAATRGVLIAAWTNAVVDTLAKPSDQEIRAYYDKNPLLFARRAHYEFVETSIPFTTPVVGSQISMRLKDGATVADVKKWLSEQKIAFHSTNLNRAAEFLPLPVLKKFAEIQPGQIGVITNPQAVLVIEMTKVTPDPVDLKAARETIVKFLLNERAHAEVLKQMKEARATAKVEAKGRYATHFTQPIPINRVDDKKRAQTASETSDQRSAAPGGQQ